MTDQPFKPHTATIYTLNLSHTSNLVLCARYRCVCMNVHIYNHIFNWKYEQPSSDLMFQARYLPWNLSLSMWELSATWPCLEENDRALLLVIDNAWTRQRAWRGVQQSTACLWQQLRLHHLQNQRNPDWVNYTYLLSFTGQFLEQSLVTDELVLAFPVTSSGQFIRFMNISKCHENADAFEYSSEVLRILNCC